MLSVCFFCQIFPRRERNFTSEAICSWVFEHHETVLQWLQPPGTKSRLLEQELTKGPALLLFLPHNPLGSNPNPILQQVSRDEINHTEGKLKLALFQLFVSVTYFYYLTLVLHLIQYALASCLIVTRWMGSFDTALLWFQL